MDEEKDIRIVAGSGSDLAKLEGKPLGVEEFRKEMTRQRRVTLPYIKLVQSMSEDASNEGIKPGNFRNTLTGEILGPTVEFVPVGILHWRRRFKGPGNREILCSSNDAVTGYGEPGGSCHSCPFAIWQVRRDGQLFTISNIQQYRAKKDEELVPPGCTEQYVFPSVVIGGQWKVPGAFVFQRTAFPDGVKLASLIELGDRLDIVYKATAVPATGPKGNWFTPKIKLERRATPEEFEPIINLVQNIKGASVEVEGEAEPENAE